VAASLDKAPQQSQKHRFCAWLHRDNVGTREENTGKRYSWDVRLRTLCLRGIGRAGRQVRGLLSKRGNWEIKLVEGEISSASGCGANDSA